jgi:hypothetical protein
MLTVNTGVESINPVVAQRSVLLAVPGADTRLVDEYLQARDKYYNDQQPLPLFPVQDPKYINHEQDRLYTIHVQAVTPGGTTERIAVLVRVSKQNSKYGGKPYEVLSWNANDRSSVIPPGRASDDESP